MCARFLVFKPASAMKVNVWISAAAIERDLESGLRKSMMSGETLVEARSDTHVQIVRYTWVYGRKTNRTIQKLVLPEVSLPQH